MGIRLMFVYKQNRLDPALQALKRWLPRCGSTVRFFRFAPSERQKGGRPEDQRLSERFRQTVEDFQPTHIWEWVPYMNMEEVRWCKRLGLTVSASVTGVTSFHSGVTPDQRQFFEMLRELDFYFVIHAPHVPVLREHGVNAYEMQPFYDPDAFKPLAAWQRLRNVGGSDVIFVGNFSRRPVNPLPQVNDQSAHRAAVVHALGQRLSVRLVSNYRVDAPGIRYLRPITYPPALNWLINRSRIALCPNFRPEITATYNRQITNMFLPYSEQTQFTIRGREFTAMGAGAACLLERHQEIQRFFEDGREVIMWSTVEEAVERAEYFIRHPNELAAIARRGHERGARLHAAPVRIKQLLSIMTGEDTKSFPWHGDCT